MKRPARVPSQLSKSLHKRLSAYTLAAGAAGVGVLASAQPAEARIVYTRALLHVDYNHGVLLDLTNDGTNNFSFKAWFGGSEYSSQGWVTVQPVGPGNAVALTRGTYTWAAAAMARSPLRLAR